MIEAFQADRRRLFDLAYTMLGSVALAEEVLQEAWLRAQAAEGVERPAAWLTTVVSRLALDELRSARARREVYPGPWLPEPVRTDTPEDASALAEAVEMATLVVLEQLTPAERAAFLLHDVFDVGYADLAVLLERSEASVRQLVSRAKRSLSTRRRRSEPDPTGHAALLGAVGLAVQTGDLEGLKRVLASDCVFVSDGGGKVVAATREVHGAERVAKLLIGLARKQQGAWTFEPAVLNHQPAVLILEDGRLTTATVFTLQAGRVARIDQIRNPDKLVSLRSVAATR